MKKCLVINNALPSLFTEATFIQFHLEKQDMAIVQLPDRSMKMIWAGYLIEDTDDNRKRLAKIFDLKKRIADVQRSLNNHAALLDKFRP